MDFSHIESTLAQWPHWLQSAVLLSIVFILIANFFSDNDYRRKAIAFLSVFICSFGVIKGFGGNDPAVGLFFCVLSIGVFTWNWFGKDSDSDKEKWVLGLFSLFLLIVFIYFGAFSNMRFPKSYSLDIPIRYNIKSHLIWGGVALVAFFHAFFHYGKPERSVWLGHRIFLSQFLIYFWTVFITITVLSNWNTLGVMGTYNRFDALTKHIYYGFHVDALNKYGTTKLHKAIRDKDLNRVIELVEAGADVNLHSYSITGNGQAPLHYAALFGDYDIFKYLIEKGVHINSVVDNPLFVHAVVSKAINTKDFSIYNLLLQKGADLNMTDRLIHMVAKLDNDPEGRLLKELIEKGEDINHVASVGTPLHFAVSSGNLNAIKVLVEAGANLSALDKQHQTPYVAAIRGVESLERFNSEYTKKRLVKCREVVKYFEGLEYPSGTQNYISDTKKEVNTKQDEKAIIELEW